MKVRSGLISAALAILFSVAVLPNASAEDRRITIVNRSSYTIWSIYGTNAGNTQWGQDRLSGTLRPDYEVTINFDDGSGACVFDLRAETRYSNQYWTRMKINVCEKSSWTLYD